MPSDTQELWRIPTLYSLLFIIFETEFHPGVPWKGLQNIDPENDPDVTPGSVPTGPTINTTIQDVNRYLLKSGGKHTNYIHISYNLGVCPRWNYPLLSVPLPLRLGLSWHAARKRLSLNSAHGSARILSTELSSIWRAGLCPCTGHLDKTWGFGLIFGLHCLLNKLCRVSYYELKVLATWNEEEVQLYGHMGLWIWYNSLTSTWE